MKVLVSDSSILIEFSKRELLDRMFQLEFQFRGAGPALS